MESVQAAVKSYKVRTTSNGRIDTETDRNKDRYFSSFSPPLFGSDEEQRYRKNIVEKERRKVEQNRMINHSTKEDREREDEKLSEKKRRTLDQKGMKRLQCERKKQNDEDRWKEEIRQLEQENKQKLEENEREREKIRIERRAAFIERKTKRNGMSKRSIYFKYPKYWKFVKLSIPCLN